MSKTQAERPSFGTDLPPAGGSAEGVPPLSRAVRRHLGQNLRGHYADSLSAR